MLRNGTVRETELLHLLSGALRAALPAGWVVTASRAAGANSGFDAVLMLVGPDEATARVGVAAKRVVEPRNVPSLVRLHEDGNGRGEEGAWLVAAPYLSPRTRELLERAGAGWFDATGNLRLQLANPVVFIDREGARRSPFTDTDDRRLKSLKGPGAARVVRALLDGETPVGVRKLAELAQVGAATSSRVLELLSREDLIERDEDGRVLAVRKQSLARRWSADYTLTNSRQAVPMLAARGIDHVLENLRHQDNSYALTAEAATRHYLPAGQAALTPLTLLRIYVPDATSTAAALQLRPTQRGANVVLVEPFDQVVFRRTQVQDRLTYAAASQVVVDLLIGPGRAPAEGDALMAALAATDEGWTR